MEIIINEDIDHMPAGAIAIKHQGDFFLNILASFGCNPDFPPLGNFLAQYHQLAGQWLVADLVSWEASHNDAMMVSFRESLELTEKEAKAFFKTLSLFFKEDKTSLFYHEKSRFLLEKKPTQPALNAKPTTMMLHQSLMPALNAMDSSMVWQQLMTELQMYLSNNPLNKEREPIINGLWIFGEGIFENPIRHKIYYTDDLKLLAAFPHVFNAITDKIPDDAVVVVNSLQSLRLKNTDKSIHWFWNNIAFSTKKIPIWKRLWRKINHAHKT